MNRIAIVHPLTLLGKELREAIAARRPGWSDFTLLSTSEEEVGTVTEIGGAAAFVGRVTEDCLEGCRRVFFCGETASDRPLFGRLDPAALGVVLSAGASVLDGPLALSGLVAAPATGLCVSPHPAAVGLVRLVSALAQLAPQLVSATVLQPASQSGNEGIDELFAQTRDLLAFGGKLPRAVFGAQLAFNVLPAPGLGAEVERQVAALLGGRPCPVRAQVMQGSAFHGLALSVALRFDTPRTAQEVARALADPDLFELARDARHLGPIASAGNERIVIGEIRPAGEDLWLWAVYDNLTVGGVYNAIALAD